MKNYMELAGELIKRAKEFSPPDEARERALNALATYIRDKLKSGQTIQLNFICTHNSRRSHLGQVMAQVLAAHYGLERFASFSGGTEATAFHPNAVRALRNLGVEIHQLDESDNPRYEIITGNLKSVTFSKKYDAPPNPRDHFAAIMVCNSADAGCPFVPGAEQRISLPFEDPKQSDGSGREEQVYQERALQIGSELAWVFQQAMH